MKMKREIFNRGTRFSHQFGDTLSVQDPLQTHTFDMPTPDPVRSLGHLGGGRSRDLHVQAEGEQRYRGQPSPVQTPTGRMTSTSGNPMDMAEAFARPMPIGTRLRTGTGIKGRK